MKLYTWEHDKKTQSFTIIELLVVIAIIGVLAGMVIGVGRSARERAKVSRTEAMIASLEVAIAMYKTDTGQHPGDNSLVNDLRTNPGGSVIGWRGPYMEFDQDDFDGTGQLVDPWGKVYFYNGLESSGTVTAPSHNTSSFDLWSYGPNTDDDYGWGDDITNW